MRGADPHFGIKEQADPAIVEGGAQAQLAAAAAKETAEFPTFPGGPSSALVSAFFLSGKGRTYRATRSGVWADPSSSTAEQGRMYFEQIEEACIRFMQGVEQTFAAYPDRP